MCRHAAYLGPPVPLSRLLFEPAHSLARQSWAPVDMRGGGTVNADGFGIGWFPARGWPDDGSGRNGGPDGGGPDGGGPDGGERNGGGPDGGAAPVRYRRACPLWADAELPGLAAVTRSGAVLAAVRSATVGMPVTEAAAAPFADGRWLFSHNGVVAGWPDSLLALAGRLPVRDLLTLPAPTDSALLWALVRARLRDGADAAEAVAATVVDVAAAAPGSRLNLLLVDADTAAATAHHHALSVWADGGAARLSSEPLDTDNAWRPVPDGHLVVATATTVRLTPLPLKEKP